MKELINETRKSQDLSKPVQTTRYQPVNANMPMNSMNSMKKEYSNNYNKNKNSV